MNRTSRITAWAATSFLLLAGKTVQPQLANTPWPMFQHDPQHTGRSPYAGPDSVAVAWTFETDEILSEPSIGNDGTIYVRTRHRFIALDANGTVKWEYDNVDIDLKAASPAINADGTIVMPDLDSSNNPALTAFYPNGTIKWQRRIGKVFDTSASSPLVDANGTAYIGSRSDTLYAIRQDGSLYWSFGTGGDIESSPTISSDGTIYFTSEDGYLYAVNSNGTLKWKFQKGGGISDDASPAVGPDGTIYVGSSDLNLYAIEPDGNLKWKKGSGGNSVQSTPAIGIDGTIYIGLTYSLKAINPDGTERWRFPIRTSDCTPAIDGDGTIYAASGALYVIRSEGTAKWTFDLPHGKNYVALGKNGWLYVCSSTFQSPGKLFALAPVAKNAVPDLVVSSFSISPTFGSTAGGPIKVGAYIKDAGGLATARCNVSFYYDDRSHLIGTTSVFVPISDSTFAQMAWPTQNFLARDYRIIAEITDADPVETDTTNNEAETSYPLLATIQPRINSAESGDTVWVAPGSYFENITLKNDIVVKSRLGPKVTVIDGRGASVTVTAANLDRSAVLEGFTVTNGKGDITTGGGIDLDLSAATIINNIISGNDPFGIFHRGFQSALVTGNLVTGNKQQGFGANNSQAIFANNTVVGNPEGVRAVGFYVPSPVIFNCIFWDNGEDLKYTAEATYSNIQEGDPGTGNISADPLFVDPINGDYHLQLGSPCIDGGDPRFKDPDGTRSDIGAYYRDQSHLRGKILGRLTDAATDQPIANARVLLSGAEGDTVQSDNDGRFIFVVSPGTGYGIRVFALNYAPAGRDSLNAGIGDSTVVSFALTRNELPSSLFPARSLTARGLENGIHLNWQPPSEELALDDGTFEEAVGFQGATGIVASGPYVPPAFPLRIEKLRLAFTGERAGDQFQAMVYVDPNAVATKPDASLLRATTSVVRIESSGAFQEIDLGPLDLALNGGSFFIGIRQLGITPMWLAVDVNAVDGNAFYDDNLDGTFSAISNAGLHGVFAIRVIVSKQVSGNEAKGALGRTAIAGHRDEAGDLTHDYGQFEIGSRLVSKKWPRISAHDSGTFAKASAIVAPTGYNLYRSGASPVALTADNLIAAIVANVTTYDDTAVTVGKTYFYVVVAQYTEGPSTPSNEVTVLVTSVNQAHRSESPQVFVLLPNYPNPFNPETTIKYQLPKNSEVSLDIYNSRGELVSVLVTEKQTAGYYAVRWNGKDQHGRQVASGIYLCRLKTGEFTQTRKMVLVR